MGIYVGDVWIPYISQFNIDDGERKVQVVRHIDSSVPPHFAEFDNPILSAQLRGTVIKNSGSIKSADNYAEDILSFLGKPAATNYIHKFQGRSGWLAANNASSPKNASTPLSRMYTVDGNFMSKAVYQSAFKSTPKIMSNPWNFELGSDDCDNYISIPIGASYRGGDGSSISQVGNDGTIDSILATNDATVRFDVPEDDVNNGEVKVFDDMNDADESNWVRVHNRAHVFVGKPVIDNSVYRIILDEYNDRFAVYAYYSGAYNKLDDFECGAFDIIRFMDLNVDYVHIKVNYASTILLERGKPVQVYTTDENLYAVSLVVPDSTTTIDNSIELSGDVYVASNTNFSTESATKNLGSGKKWLFYDTDPINAVKVAHRALVEGNIRRELLER